VRSFLRRVMTLSFLGPTRLTPVIPAECCCRAAVSQETTWTLAPAFTWRANGASAADGLVIHVRRKDHDALGTGFPHHAEALKT